MARRPKLPPEIIARILEAMCEPTEPWLDQPPPFGPPTPYRALRRCALVSGTFYSVATPILHRHLRIGLRYGRDCSHIVTDCTSLEDKLLMHTNLGNAVLTIKLFDDRGREGARADNRDSGNRLRHTVVKTLASLMACCPNVRGVGRFIAPPALVGVAHWLGLKHPEVDSLVLGADSWETDDLTAVLDRLPHLRVLVLRGPVIGGRRQRRRLPPRVSLTSLDLNDRACDAFPLFLPLSAHTLRRLDLDTCRRGWSPDFDLDPFVNLSEVSVVVDCPTDFQEAIESLAACSKLKHVRLELVDDSARPSDLMDTDLSPLSLGLRHLDVRRVPLPFPPVFLFLLSRPPGSGCLKFSKRSWTKRERRGLLEWVQLARQAIDEGSSFAFT